MFRIIYFVFFALVCADWRFPYRDAQHSGAIFVNETYFPFYRNLKGGAYTTAIGDDGTIFTASGSHLVAISPSNETIWSYDASGGQINSGNVISNFGNGPACIHDGRIFILSSNTTSDGFLVWGIHAVDVDNGDLIWKNMLGIETVGAATLMIGSTGIVYMNQMPLSTGEGMIAFDPSTGDVIWNLQFTDLNLFAMENPIDGTIVVAGSNKTKGLHPKTGETLWTSDDLIGFDFSIDQNGIIYGLGFNLLAINASNGERIWMSQLGSLSGAWWVPVTLSDGRLFMPYFPADIQELNKSYVSAFDINGNLLWNVTTCNGSTCGSASGSCNVVVVGGVVYTGFGNSVGALDVQTGKLVWSQSLGNNFYADNIYAVVSAVETSLIVTTSNEITNDIGMQVINVPNN